MLVNLREIFDKYKNDFKAIAAFNVANTDMVRAVVDAACLEGKPVVIQVFRRLLDDKTGEYLSEIIKYIVKDIDIPMVLHLDHAIDLIQIRKALDYGFTSVMIDGSVLDFNDNVSLTKETKKLIDSYGFEDRISVEAEIGGIPPASGDSSINNYELTDPEQAEEFVKLTNIDAMAVAFGTAHGIYTKKPELDFNLLKAISKRVKVPLVLHGGTGLSPDVIKKAIKSGIKKVNVATELQKFYIDEIVKKQIENKSKFMPLDIMIKPIRDNLMNLIRLKIKMISY